MEDESFTTKRGITFNQIHDNSFDDFVTDLQSSIILNQQSLYEVLSDESSTNWYQSAIKQLIYENRLVEERLIEILQDHKIINARNLLAEQINLEAQHNYEDVEEDFLGRIDELNFQLERREKIVGSLKKMSTDLEDTNNLNRRNLALWLLKPDQSIEDLHVEWAENLRKIQKLFRSHNLTDVHCEIITQTGDELQLRKNKVQAILKNPIERKKKIQQNVKSKKSKLSYSFDKGCKSLLEEEVQEPSLQDEISISLSNMHSTLQQSKAVIPELDISNYAYSRQKAESSVIEEDDFSGTGFKVKRMKEVAKELEIELEQVSNDLMGYTTANWSLANENELLAERLELLTEALIPDSYCS